MKKLVCEECGFVAEEESANDVMDAMLHHVEDAHPAKASQLEAMPKADMTRSRFARADHP